MHARRQVTPAPRSQRARGAVATAAGVGVTLIAVAGAGLEGHGVDGANLARCALSGAVTAALALVLTARSGAAARRPLATTSAVLAGSVALAALMAVLDLVGAAAALA